jgi:hypothetical protein
VLQGRILARMAVAFRKEMPYGIPKGTGFHAFRHAYNALIDQVGTDDPKKVKGKRTQVPSGMRVAAA